MLLLQHSLPLLKYSKCPTAFTTHGTPANTGKSFEQSFPPALGRSFQSCAVNRYRTSSVSVLHSSSCLVAVTFSFKTCVFTAQFPAFSWVLEKWPAGHRVRRLASVSLSVCLSADTLASGFKTKKASVMISSPSESLNILVSRNIWLITKFERGHPSEGDF